jgi:hypothetical protein
MCATRLMGGEAVDDADAVLGCDGAHFVDVRGVEEVTTGHVRLEVIVR